MGGLNPTFQYRRTPIMRILTFLLSALVVVSVGFAQTTVTIDPAEVIIPAVGKQIELSIEISEAKNVLAYQFKLNKKTKKERKKKQKKKKGKKKKKKKKKS